MFKNTLQKKLVSIVLSAALVFTGLSFTSVDVSAASNSYGLATDIQDGTILHCFDWTYQQIIDELPNIAASGFTSVQTSPAQVSMKGSSIWYYLYQPNTFTVGDNGLGSEDDLKELCSEADKYGIKVIVDVVANHLAGDHTNIDSSLQDSQYWHDYTGSIDYTNRWQITHGQIGMPDLNSENSYVASKVKSYIQELKSDGVDGIRWDAAKHISLPSEGCNFWSTVIDSSMYNYGEILDAPVSGSDATSLMSEYTDYMSVTDSGYSSTVLGALNGGSIPSSYANWTTKSGIDNDEVVYWGESHDTYSNDSDDGGWTKYIDQNIVDRAYAIVASRNDATALYFSRPSQTAKSSIMVGEKGSTHFTSAEVAQVNKFHNLCVGEADYYTADTNYNCAVVTRESGAVLVLGSGSNKYVSVANGGSYTTPGTYVDQVSGNTFTVTSTTISGTIGSTGIAVLYHPSDDDDDDDDDDDTDTTRTIYFDATNCSWYTNDSAVAAIKTNKDSSYTKMTTTTIDGKTVYTASVSSSATSATVVRMLSSGNYYNSVNITLSSSYNYYTTDSNLSNVTTSQYNSSDDQDDDDDDDDDQDDDETDTITLYFTNNYNWSTVYAYAWGGSNTSVNWPGTQMTYVKQNEYNQAVYKIEIAADSTGLIFNNGSGSQTVDITSLTDGTGYYISGSNGKYTVGTYTYK